MNDLMVMTPVYVSVAALVAALGALIIPNRRHALRRGIWCGCVIIAAPGLAMFAFANLWEYACISWAAIFGAFGFAAALALALLLLPFWVDMAPRIRALLRILAVWVPLPLANALVHLIAHLVGYRIVVA